MSWKKNPSAGWKLYCIIDEKASKATSVKNALFLFQNGVKVVQLRSKNSPSYMLIPLARKIRSYADKYGAELLINDRVDVAMASGAHGVHVGSGDLPAETARRLLRQGAIVGKTVHSLGEAKKAGGEKINYISAGPVFSTPIKKNLKKHGLRFLKKIKANVEFPLFAIGGINKKRLRAVLKSGADGACVLRAWRDAKGLLAEIGLITEKGIPERKGCRQ